MMLLALELFPVIVVAVLFGLWVADVLGMFKR